MTKFLLIMLAQIVILVYVLWAWDVRVEWTLKYVSGIFALGFLPVHYKS